MAKELEQVISEIQDAWMAIDGVIGVGSTIIDDEPAIMVIVNAITPTIKEGIPSQYGGYKVGVLEGGDISAQR